MTDQTKGFEISHEHSPRIVTVRMYGRWNQKVGQQFLKMFQEKANAMHTKEREWYILLDVARCPPQSQEIQDLLGDALWFAKQHGSSKQAVVAKIPRIPLQTEILVQRVGMQSIGYFRTEQDAAQWLLVEPETSE